MDRDLASVVPCLALPLCEKARLQPMEAWPAGSQKGFAKLLVDDRVPHANGPAGWIIPVSLLFR